MFKKGETMFKEWKAIFKKPTFIIVMIGISLIPALYNVIFLSSMWDPYGQLSNLPVAVVNNDKEASYNGNSMSIGKDMVSNLKENKTLDFHFVDEEEGKKGLENGDYYMVVTLPSDLSEKAASILTNHPEQMQIDYQTSSGHSFIASKMSDSAMTQLKQNVSTNVTETYTKALFDKMVELKDGMSQAASGSEKLTDRNQANVELFQIYIASDNSEYSREFQAQRDFLASNNIRDIFNLALKTNKELFLQNTDIRKDHTYALEIIDYVINMEIKSVNNKNLATKIKLPYNLNLLESFIRGEIASLISRGSIDFRIEFENKNESLKNLKYDENLAKSCMDILNKMEEDFNDKFSNKLDFLVRNFGVISQKDLDTDEEKYKEIIDLKLKELLQNFIKTKVEEGNRLRVFFKEQLSILKSKLEQVKPFKESANDDRANHDDTNSWVKVVVAP